MRGLTPPSGSLTGTSQTGVEQLIDRITGLDDGDDNSESGKDNNNDGEDLIDLYNDITDDFTEHGEERDLTKQDAGVQILREHLETIQEAELAAKLVEKQGKTCTMLCDKLEDPPDEIQQIFSAVLGDAFHAMNRAKVPVRHEYKKTYYVALMNAFFVWDESRLKEVKKTLKDNGWSDQEINTLQYYRPAFFQKCVEWIVLPPKQLYWRIRAVFVKFGNKVDTKTKRPLFNEQAWAKAKNVLKEILQGFYSDPPGFNFYTLGLDGDGNAKLDKYGLPLIKCNRGTCDVENIHRYYHRAFKDSAGYELGDCLLAEQRHQHNVNKFEKHVVSCPKLGHFNTWQVDHLQILVEKNHGLLLFPGWVNATSYRDTEEGFVTVALHSKELDGASKVKAKTIDDEVKTGYSGNLRFLCMAINVDIPFLPVDGTDEYRLFSHLMLSEMSSFNDDGTPKIQV